MNTETAIKKGDYVLCRFNGKSGDVVVGVVKSVSRKTGAATVTNLLTGEPSHRHIDILRKRNIAVPRTKALEIKALFEKNKDKAKTRTAAVELVQTLRGPQLKPSKAMKAAVKRIAAAKAAKSDLKRITAAGKTKKAKAS